MGDESEPPVATWRFGCLRPSYSLVIVLLIASILLPLKLGAQPKIVLVVVLLTIYGGLLIGHLCEVRQTIASGQVQGRGGQVIKRSEDPVRFWGGLIAVLVLLGAATAMLTCTLIRLLAK